MNTKTKKFLLVTLTCSLLLSGTNVLFAQDTNGTSTNGTSTAVSADTLEPTDVENLKAVAGDTEVLLTWDAARDNVGVTSYKIYRGNKPVKTADDSYDLPTIPVGNVKSYAVKNLTNGQLYYFTVTALDSAGNESINYAVEASALPKSGQSLPQAAIDDGKSPQVKSVKTEDVITVLVQFEEPVKLPEEHPASAFTIEKIVDKSRLEVQSAVIDERDATGTTVLLTTAPQEAKAEYLLTAGIEVQDLTGNPIISGTADTGSFKGGEKQKSDVVENEPVTSETDSESDLRGSGGELKDLVPPEDVTKLLAQIKDAERNIVELKWSASKNSANDLADQMLYQSKGKYTKSPKDGTSLGATTDNIEVQDLKAGNWYTFKVTTKDTAGNESKGSITAIYLPQTGPGLVAVMITSVFMGVYSRKMKRK